MEIIDKIRNLLKENSDEKYRISGQRFFKENVILYGVRSSNLKKLSNDCFREIKHLDKYEIFNICEALFQSGYLEESFVACHFSYSVRKQYTIDDFKKFEGWISSYITNWATCDTFCNHTVGELLELYPSLINSIIENWTISENRWMKRAAAVSLIVPARKGMFLDEVFKIADILLLDKDDMVQKGYGWLLKVASNKHLSEVFDYVMKNKSVMPRTSLRYAIEKMPAELKSKAMQKK